MIRSFSVWRKTVSGSPSPIPTLRCGARVLPSAWALMRVSSNRASGPSPYRGPRPTISFQGCSAIRCATSASSALRFLPFAGHAFVVARSGWSKQGGFEIYIDDAASGQALWDALFAAGGDLSVGPGCPNLIERIEGALLSHGNDMTLANNPFECALDRFVNLESPVEFIGRDALERIRDSGGPERIIRGIRFDGIAAPNCVEPWPVLRSGEPAGQVTSAAFSPNLATNVALAMVERSAWDPGTPVSVTTPDGTREGEVTDLPFIGR